METTVFEAVPQRSEKGKILAWAKFSDSKTREAAYAKELSKLLKLHQILF